MTEDRTNDIQDISDTVAVANLQLNKLLQQLQWSKDVLLNSKSNLVKCSFDGNHLVKQDNLNKHHYECAMRRYDVVPDKSKDILLWNDFFYKNTDVVCVKLGKDDYKEFGYDLDIENSSAQNIGGSLLETDDNLGNYQPCSSLDELRFIYSWSRIPLRYYELDAASKFAEISLKSYLEENLSCYQKEHNNIVDDVIALLNKPINADQFADKMSDYLQKDNISFTLNLWKFITAKSLCVQHHISEHTRNEFDVYSNVIQPKEKRTDSRPKFPPPTEWMVRNLTREQRLKVYEKVCQIGKSMAKHRISFEELAKETEQQKKVLDAFEERGEKTHSEIMAELRDYKRRRQSYRGKSKMATKLSVTEVFRDLIEQQMLYLTVRYQQHQDEIQQNIEQKETEQQNKKVQNIEAKQHSESATSSEKSHDYKSHSTDRNSRHRSKERYRSRSRSKDRSRSRHSKHRSRDDSERRKRYRESGSRNRDKNDRYRKSNSEAVSNVTVYEK